MAYPTGSTGARLWGMLAGSSLVIAAVLIAAVTFFRSLAPPAERAAPVVAPSGPDAVASEPNATVKEARTVPDRNRAVSSEQQVALSKEVSVKGMKLAIMKYSDKEAAAYANQLIDAFRKSGARVQTLLVGISDDPAAGIVLDRNGGETERIATYLAKAGIPFTIGQAASVPRSARVAFSGVPIVVVGLKP